jgi:poly(3-hydroxybutyrate) depolymerase
MVDIRVVPPRAGPTAARAWLIVTILLGSPAVAAPLGPFPVDPAQISVSGISSGAFMANQLHVAHSAGIMGAAMIAGGLYGCAAIDVTQTGVVALASQAVGACMSAPALLQNPGAYKDTIAQLFEHGWIDDPANLAGAHIYLFTGRDDHVVNPATVERAARVYRALGVPAAHIAFSDRAVDAGHSWVTADYGSACPANAPPFINDCSYDQAGIELAAIYGTLQPKAAAQTGRMIAFDQTEFVPGGAAAANGLSNTGYFYVPKTCEPGAAKRCRLHIVLHGCLQSAEIMNDTFYRHIGVNEWADTNGILVLYPQAHGTTVQELAVQNPMSTMNANPNGCWNWWGYAFDAQYLTRKGVQIGAIWAMVRRLEGK